MENICKAIRQCEPDGLFLKRYVGGGTMLDAFLEAIARGQLRDVFPHFLDFPTLSDLSCGYGAVEFGDASLATVLDFHKRELEAEETWMFTTREGYLGATSSEVKAGNLYLLSF